MLRLLLLSFSVLSLAIIISCSNEEGNPEPKEVEVTFFVSNLGLERESSPLRSDALPMDFSHLLGGNGNLSLSATDGSLSISIDVTSDNFLTTSFTVPSGSYNISYSSADNWGSCGLSTTLPFTASANNVQIDSNTTQIELLGSTTFDAVIVKDFNLCGNNDVVWNGSGTRSECGNFSFIRKGNYYILYFDQDALNEGDERFYIKYYDGSSCRFIYVDAEYIGGHANIYNVVLEGNQSLSVDLYSIFTTTEIEIGVGIT